MKPSFYLKAYPCSEDRSRRLLFSLQKSSVVRVKNEIYQALKEGALPRAQADLFAKIGMAVDDPVAEKQAAMAFFDRLNAKNPELNVTAVMNLDCNFACTYCYEGNTKGKYYMTEKTADRLMDFVVKKFGKNKKILRIDFYGGEPLLSLDLIKRISAKARFIANSSGALYKFSLVTNGSLLKRRTVEELAGLGLERVRVTLDGPAETHNRSRPFKTGAGSFEKIIENLRDVWDLVKIGIGGNFERHNYSIFPKLLDYLLETGLAPDKIDAIKFDPVVKQPKGESTLPEYRGGCASTNEPWLLEAEAFLREEILKRGYATQKIQPVACMVDVKDSYVVNFDGKIYKCPAFIGKKSFEVGDLENGIGDYSEIYKTEYWKNEKCADCVYLPLCFGGCRYMSYVRSGRIDAVDCRKAYLDVALENLVKQDARYPGRKRQAVSPPKTGF